MLTRISLTIDGRLLDKVDALVDGGEFKNRSQTISMLLRKSLSGSLVERAVVLAGKNNFLLEKILIWLKKNGIDDVVIASGRNKAIAEKIGDGSAMSIRVEYTHDENRGTALALKQARRLLKQPFILCYSDVFCENLNLRDVLSFHDSRKAVCTLVLTSSKHPSNYGVARMMGDKVIGFDEKPTSAEGFLVNAGVAVCNPSVFEHFSREASFERHVLPSLARQGQLSGFLYYGKWLH